jgi:hypothetical protein
VQQPEGISKLDIQFSSAMANFHTGDFSMLENNSMLLLRAISQQFFGLDLSLDSHSSIFKLLREDETYKMLWCKVSSAVRCMPCNMQTKESLSLSRVFIIVRNSRKIMQGEMKITWENLVYG